MEDDFRPKLIALFEGWLDGSIALRCFSAGICGNTFFLIRILSDKYDHHFQNWDKYSGNLYFPVPPTNEEYTAKEQYDYTPNLWIGEQGELRRDLLRHLIKCLKAEMEGGNV